jgi:hypothetical protein
VLGVSVLGLFSSMPPNDVIVAWYRPGMESFERLTSTRPRLPSGSDVKRSCVSPDSGKFDGYIGYPDFLYFSDLTSFFVQQGTIEEQKYLRQVYKTQLKNETIVEVDQDDREVAARLFRGVAGDDTRRGELFGIANLLRFKDGTFMNYGTQTREEARFGENIYNVETLLSNAQGNNDGALGRVMGEDQSENDLAAALMVNDEDDQEEEEGVADLVGLTENGECSL